MELNPEIFRANDIRGLLAEVTPEVAYAVGAALVRVTGAACVVVGRDMRTTSPELAQEAMRGITDAGADVRDIGMCTTSMYNFAVTSSPDVGAGLMVTASHNPPEYNGIKLARANGLPIPGTAMLAPAQEPWTPAAAKGRVAAQDILGEYLDACVSHDDVPDLRGTKVVIDYGNGMGALSLRPLCARLGIDAVELYAEPDARFPNHEANPAKVETLAALKAAVVREGATCGVALDGDADRIAFVDNEGEHLRGDQTLALFAEDMLARTPGAQVVVAPSMSWAVCDAIRAAGGQPVECAIGRTVVVKTMHDTGAPLGGEISSHFMFGEFHNLEAVDYAFVRALSLGKRSGKTFADLARPLRAYANSGEINIEIHDKRAAIERATARFAPQATVVNTRDGVRCEFGRSWWFLVRPSNTEPILRLIVEATDRATMEARRDALVAVLRGEPENGYTTSHI